MKIQCDHCGKEPEEGEMFVQFLDPKSDWWLTIMNGPSYCEACAAEVRAAKGGAKADA